MKNKTVLVTGSTGFIGKHVVPGILKEGYTVHCPDRYSIVEDIKKWKPNVIVHLAGNPSTKPVSDNEILKTNIELTHNCILAAPPDCHFLLASTILVYGDGYRHYEKDSCNPTSVYAATKLAAEALVNAYNNQRLIRGINLRMSATVGSGMNHGALPELLNKCLNDTSVKAFGKYPGSVKPYTHIFDVVKGIIFAIDKELTGTYNLCVGDNWSIDCLIDDILELTNLDKHVYWDSEAVWGGDNPYLECDNNKIRTTGFKFQFPSSQRAVRQAIIDILNENGRQERNSLGMLGGIPL